MKAVVISVLLLGCFLMMANLAPSLLTSSRTDETDSRKLSSDQIKQSIAILIGMLVALTLVLHYWR